MTARQVCVKLERIDTDSIRGKHVDHSVVAEAQTRAPQDRSSFKLRVGPSPFAPAFVRTNSGA